MDLRLRGKRAIVTGAGVGIGRAIAAELAREGVGVAMCARSADTLEQAAKEIAGETGSRVLAIPADMRDPADIQRFVEEAAAGLGGIDIVVNNAGASIRASFVEHPDEDWQDAMLLKFHGYVRVSRAALPHLQQAGGGVILNIIGTGGKVYTEHHVSDRARQVNGTIITIDGGATKAL